MAEHSNDGRWWRKLRAVGAARGSGKDTVASSCDGLMAAAVVRLRFQVVRVELRRQKVLGGGGERRGGEGVPPQPQAISGAEGGQAAEDTRAGGGRRQGESESETASPDTWQAATGVTCSAHDRSQHKAVLKFSFSCIFWLASNIQRKAEPNLQCK
jgi:hypothetical protein